MWVEKAHANESDEREECNVHNEENEKKEKSIDKWRAQKKFLDVLLAPKTSVEGYENIENLWIELKIN